MKTGLRINRDETHNGFQITFENGITASVQFGKYSYSGDYPEKTEFSEDYSSPNAECAAFYETDEYERVWCPHPDWSEDVCGYMTPNEILGWMN